MLRKPLALLLLAYVLLASLYSIVTPLFEASDEVWHYPMVKYLADNALALPVQQPGAETAWRQEGSQPPLYYMLAALLTFWIDTSDLDAVRKINPHADIGVIVPDGNVNMTIHDPAVRAFPWRGTTLAVHLVRFFSVALGAVTVLMTYRLADALFPARDNAVNWLALGAAAFTAFNPMFLFISGSVNNDNLSNALASALLVLIVRLLRRRDRPSIRELVGIGALAGAGMLAKFNIGFLLPLIALALALLAWRWRDLRFFVVSSAITGGLTILIAGWWYVRNWSLYGDPTGLNVFIQIVGPRPIPANWAQLWSERHTFLMSYWGFFGGVNVPLPDVAYTVFNGIAALAGLGLLVGLAAGLKVRLRAGHERPRQQQDYPAILAGRAVSVLWIVALFGGLARWTGETWASQGRLLFSAIAPLSLWMAVGLWALGRWLPLIRWRLGGVAIGWFVAAAVFSPVVIARAYTDLRNLDIPEHSPRELIRPVFFSETEQGKISIGISGAAVPEGPYRPGDYVQFCERFHFSYEAGARFTRDWSAFVHLETPDGVIVAQRDVYLRQGQLATSLFDPGDAAGGRQVSEAWSNCFAVRLPDHAYAPQRLDVYLGFYDLRTGERLWANASPDHRAFLGTVKLLPRESDLPVPNPMQVNLDGEAELVGYDIAPGALALRPGEPVTVTLYWRARRPLTTNYRVFVQIVEPNTTHVFARSDAMPAAWTRPTSTWEADEIVADEHTFTVSADAPPGIWQVVVGMYELIETAEGQQFRRLRVITPDGGEALDYVALTRVRIEPDGDNP